MSTRLTRGVVAMALAVTGFACDGDVGETASQVGLNSLSGSDFEIDDDASLILDGTGTMDWATVTEARNSDAPSGTDDDSFAGGSKEDDACPGTTTGSIPNNKSDLKTFGVYEEAGSPGFLHFFWSRVQEPNGTTLMDFELNQSSEDCGNGLNPVRTIGDLLLEYRIEQGGAQATIKIREWEGTVWGAALDLTEIGAATGTINHSDISDVDSDGLGPHSPRTFGEASVDLSFIFDEASCTSFGSVFVKSRASDAFNSQLKDYIAPTAISINNCGKVTIRKVTDPSGLTESFDYTHNLQTDPASGTSFSLADGESEVFDNVLLGAGYTVTETSLPSGFDLDNIDCSASSGVTPTVNGATVTFDIDDVADTVDCTYTNKARGTIIVEKITGDGSGSFDFTSSSLTPSAFSLTTSGAGVAGKDSRTFGDLIPGSYDVAETVPAGWNLQSASCDDGSSPASISLEAGETVTCTFVNQRQTGAIRILKTRKHAGAGPGDHPHPGVTFLISGGDLAVPVPVVTDASGNACVDGRVLSAFVGDYTVTETVPTGYVADGDVAKTVTVTAEASCPSGDLVTFGNTPLTNITVAVDSIIDGGTASTITCTGVSPATTGPGGDGSLTLTNLLPGTYTCTVVVDP